jgi:hypothetical protein
VTLISLPERCVAFSAGAEPLKWSRPVIPPFGPVLVTRKVVFTEMTGEVLEHGPALKADHAIFLNGLPKVSTVIGKLLGEH